MKKTPMKTECLSLRSWKLSDARDLFECAREPSVGKSCGWSAHRSIEESEECIRNVLSVPETYAIVLRETGRAIGCIALKSPNAVCAGIEPDSMELGFWLGVPWQGRGLIQEAAQAVLAHAFCDLQLASVWCGCFPDNLHSKHAQEKMGFVSHHTESKVPTALGEYREICFSRMTLDDWILGRLQCSADANYKAFSLKLIPGIDPDTMLGVRLPELRRLAKRIGPGSRWLKGLPHRYLEENLLHAMLISMDENPEICMEHLREFLPYADNWSVCDTISPKCFADGDKRVFAFAKSLIASGQPYMIRFGYVTLLRNFTKDAFRPRHMDLIGHTAYDHYYVRMAVAWYLAEAMIAHFDDVYYYLEHTCPDADITKYAIRKGIESFRVSEEHKNQLKSLRTALSLRQ